MDEEKKEKPKASSAKVKGEPAKKAKPVKKSTVKKTKDKGKKKK